MSHDRRTFLNATGVAGAAIATGAAAGIARPAPAAAQATGAPQPLPKGMSFATLRRDGGGHGLGIRSDHGVLDVVRAEQDLKEGAPTSIDDVLHGRGDVAGLRRLLDKARASASADRYFVAEKAAQLGPCVTNPGKIVCIGLNYRRHAAETNNPVPTTPILFNKYNSALNHHGGTIAVSKEKAEKFDYEAELVIVMGRTARDVAETDALNYVFGYCTGNDFSARDLQMRTSQWMLGKTGDGYAPVGPWLVTADQVDPNNLRIELWVNDEPRPRQSSNTNDMVFNCQQLIAYISKHMTLQPGDIIFTGTPEGVIAGYPKDKQAWLKSGDKLVTKIEKLGDLEFRLT
jgi:2-keto-4-pentenoate hydratase/2-oxohepta-3-ene-1,7-dioic acid hydratase in catechol pathway